MKRLLAGLALALLGTPAMALPGTYLIEADNSGTCVARKSGKAVLARCNGNDPSQRWAFLMNGQIRPANAVGSCLGVRASGARRRDWSANALAVGTRLERRANAAF